MLPEIEMDCSAVDWEEFMVSWTRHRETFDLAGPGLIRQVIACLKFIESLSHSGLDANNPSGQQDSNPGETAQLKFVSEIVDSQAHIQSQGKSRSRRRSQKKSRRKTPGVPEQGDRLNTFMAENQSYQPEDFMFNSLSFGEVAALMYSARKVTKEMQSINKVKIPHMLKQDMKWIVRRAESQPVVRLAVQVSTKSYTANARTDLERS